MKNKKNIRDFMYNHNLFGYLGMTIGCLAPLFIARYLFFENRTNDVLGAAISWTGSIIINFSPSLLKKERNKR